MNRVRRYLPSASRSYGAKKGKVKSVDQVFAQPAVAGRGRRCLHFWFVWLILDTLDGFLEGSTYVEIG